VTVIEHEASWIRPHMRGECKTVEAPADGAAAARRALRDQIARLDGELSDLALSMWPHTLPEPGDDAGASRVRTLDGSTVLSLGQLERARDELAARLSAGRRVLDELGAQQEAMRRAREELLAEPQRHRFARVTNADVGEAGCRDWHVRPRFGLIGMLAGWWRVVISSGCPLAVAPGGRPQRRRVATFGW
jgi:hypothetical protein